MREPFDIADTEELMRTVGGTQTVAPGCRWRRSRWQRNCPVELSKGNFVPGKAEYAVGLVGHLYVLNIYFENTISILLKINVKHRSSMRKKLRKRCVHE